MRRSCARATLAAFFVWWELLGAQPLMPDFLGSVGGAEDEGESVDFLGKKIPLAFKSPAALPAGGGPAAGVAAAPPSVAGAGTVVGGGAAGGGGGAGGGAAGPSTLQQIAQALGLSQQTIKALTEGRRLFGGGPNQGTPSPTLPGVTEVETATPGPGVVTADPSFNPLVTEGAPADAALAAEAEGGATGAEGAGGGGGSTTGAIAAVGRLGKGAYDISQTKGASDEEKAALAAHNIGLAVADFYTMGLAELGPLIGGEIGSDNIFGQMLQGYPGLAHGDDQARIARDIASAKNVMGAKVPAAMSRLGKTLNDVTALDPASATTEQLLAAQNELQAARQEFNAVDHAFKGGITVAGKPINTGLTLDMVKPQLDALNESQLRIQDALESRGIQSGQIPGYQSPLDWLNFVAPDFYNSVRGIDANALKNFERDPAYYGLDPNDPTLAMARELGAIQPGQTEAGLRGYVAGHRPPVSSASLVRAAFGDQSGGYADAAGHVDAP